MNITPDDLHNYSQEVEKTSDELEKNLHELVHISKFFEYYENMKDTGKKFTISSEMKDKLEVVKSVTDALADSGFFKPKSFNISMDVEMANTFFEVSSRYLDIQIESVEKSTNEQIKKIKFLEGKVIDYKMQEKDKGKVEIPKSVIKTLEDSQSVLQKLAHKLDYDLFLQITHPITTDEHGLLSEEVPSSKEQFHINLGLLMNEIKMTTDETRKKELSFLALNYLAKAGTVTIPLEGVDAEIHEKLHDMFQVGFMSTEADYHRESSVFEKILYEEVKTHFNDGNPFLLTNTKDVQFLLPIYGKAIDVRDKDKMKKELSQGVESLCANFCKTD